MRLFVGSLLVSVVVLAGSLLVLRPSFATQRLPRRLLAYAGWPLALVGAIFVLRFWHPTAGPYEADVRYPFGGFANAWAVSFGFAWMACGVLLSSLALLAPPAPSAAVYWVLLTTWGLCWLPHGVIGVAVLLDGMTASSAIRYEQWAARPLGAVVLGFDAILLILHFGMAVTGFVMEGRALVALRWPQP